MNEADSHRVLHVSGTQAICRRRDVGKTCMNIKIGDDGRISSIVDLHVQQVLIPDRVGVSGLVVVTASGVELIKPRL